MSHKKRPNPLPLRHPLYGSPGYGPIPRDELYNDQFPLPGVLFLAINQLLKERVAGDGRITALRQDEIFDRVRELADGEFIESKSQEARDRKRAEQLKRLAGYYGKAGWRVKTAFLYGSDHHVALYFS